MAKYTETLYEYIEGGGSLPSSFAQIEGFETLFVQHFAGREIGFETEPLFKNALEEVATINIPYYKDKLAIINSAMERLKNPEKTRREKRTYGEAKQTTNSNASSKEVPFDVDASKPSASSQSSATTTSQTHEDEAEYADYVTIDENLRLLEEATQTKFNVLDKLLHEFDHCFMGVYWDG